MRKIIIIMSMFFCIWQTSAQQLNVAAAADLRFAMDEIVIAYKKTQPKSDIRVTYGSSGNAYQQIINGAPYDVYFSVDIIYPKQLHARGLTATEPQVYALGFIVLWSSTIDVSEGMNALAGSDVRKIAIANPVHAPYGLRAQESLKYHKIFEKVKSKLIMGENISQAAQFTQTGNAEVGILALSLVLSPSMHNKGRYYMIDAKSYSPLEQAFVVTKRGGANAEAHRFAQFFSNVQVREILKKYGFELPSV